VNRRDGFMGGVMGVGERKTSSFKAILAGNEH
jgi:hypothetical protein